MFCSAALVLLFVTLTCSYAAEGDVDAHPRPPSNCTAEDTTFIKALAINDTIRVGKVSDTPDDFIDTGGIYLMPNGIPRDGTIISVRAFGILGDDAPPNVILYLWVLAFRENDGTYNLLYDEEYTHNNITSAEEQSLNWDVKKGDVIGAFVPYDCIDELTGSPKCPSQINLRISPEKCFYLQYFPVDSDDREDFMTIPADRLEEVQVRLNMAVEIGETTTNMKERIIIATVAVILLVLLSVAGVLLVLMCCVRKRERKELSLYKHSFRGEIVEEINQPAKPECSEPAYEMALSNSQDSLSGYERIKGEEETSSIAKSVGVRTVRPTASNSHDGCEIDAAYDYAGQDPYFQPADQQEELFRQLDKILAVVIIQQEELELCEVLGSGAFGTVYKGVWSHTKAGSDGRVREEVAVKTIDSEASESERIKFWQEAAIMAQFKHNNIVQMKGILMEKKLMMIVIDLLKGGDLRQYLLTSVRNSLDSVDPLELSSMLLSYTRQVAVGVVYLMRKAYIHRDLAARNVLVSEDGEVCKIGDFGLSRELQDENFYVSHGGKIPVKWTAPEALQYRRYSTASDMWSYGCVLYEIWSLGEKPFHDMSNQEAMKYVLAGHRLHPPPGCPKAIYNIMINCWNPSAEERQEPCEVVQQLQRSDYHILKWSVEDINAYSKEARTIGAPLHLGRTLFPEMQNTYLKLTTTESHSQLSSSQNTSDTTYI